MSKHVSWLSLPGSWYQKIFLNNEGMPIYSYHYGNKLQPASKVLVLETQKSQRLSSYELIAKDLRDIAIMLDECEKIYSKHNLPFLPNETPNDGIILKAIISAIIIHYFRCFPGGNGRKFKLQEQHISETNLATHDLLKKMRNEYIAHSDDSIFEECKIVFLVPPEKKIQKNKTALAMTNRELYQMIGGEDLIQMIRGLVNDLQNSTTQKIDDLAKEIFNEINGIPKHKFYKYLKDSGSSNRVKLTQELLEKLTN